MSEKQRKSFTAQFKAKVALEAIRGEKTLNEIGREFGIHPNLVGQWKREVQEHAAGLWVIANFRNWLILYFRLQKLYAEIGRLKVELSWLKKKVDPYL